MLTGVTHTQAGRPVSGVGLHAQSIMGWGTLNPEPSFGRLDWRTLDERVNAMRNSPGMTDMALTLCAAPDWMKGGKQGETDWSRIEVAPYPQMFDAFAWLCAQTAARYPDVRYFVIWNELKGFWNSHLGQWGTETYTALYRKVALAIKKVRPDAKVGGPYAPLSTPTYPDTVDPNGWAAIRDWWHRLNGAPCDFLCVDGWGTSEWFAETTRMLKKAWPCMPIWWNELHVINGDWPGTIAAVEKAGADAVLLWEPDPGRSWVALDALGIEHG